MLYLAQSGLLFPPFFCSLLIIYLKLRFLLTQLLAGYGLTETSPVLCNQLVEHRVLGCIGPPSPGVQIKILDPESGQPVAPGTTGLLFGKS